MNRSFTQTLSLLSLSLLLAACSNASNEAKKTAQATTPTSTTGEVVVKIGHAGPLTGGLANIGKDDENGAQLAIDEINAKGLTVNGQKIKLQLQSEDDAGDPKQGLIVAQKLVDSKVVAVVGHVNSGVSIPANKIYADAGIAQISPASTHPDYTLKGNKTPNGNVTSYRVVATDNKQGPALVQYISKQGGKSIAVLDDSSQFGKGLADQVAKIAKESGITVTERDAATDKTTDFKPILTKLKAQNPDYIFWAGFGDTAAPLAKQIKELGLKAKLIAPDGTCTDAFIQLAGAASEGTVCSQAGIPVGKLARGADFSRKYEAKYPGQTVQIYAPYAYDAVYAFVEAIKKANSIEPEAIAAALPQVSFEGLIGKVEFDATGELKSAGISILQVQSKKFTVIDTVL